MPRQIVIDSTTKQVKRHGYTTFTIDPNTEQVIEMDFDFIPNINEQDWYYDEVNNTFVQTPP